MFPRLNLTATLSYGLNVAYPYALGPWVSNPTSGGTLVDDQQFLGVPQQQGSVMLIWARNGWHASTALTFAGWNNTLEPAAVHPGRRGARQKLRAHRPYDCGDQHFQRRLRPVYALRCGVPYRGLYTGPSNSQYLANYPTDALNIEPAAVKFIITFHE